MTTKNNDAATKILRNAGFSKNGAKLESPTAKAADKAESKKQAKAPAEKAESKKQAKADGDAASKAPSYLKLPDGTPDALVVKMLVQENPKRGASAERFNLYRDGMTVAAALAAGLQRADLRWDLAHGWISIAPGKAVAGSKKPAKKVEASA